MLTDERVAEIRARLAAATPGPWYAEPDGDRLMTVYEGCVPVVVGGPAHLKRNRSIAALIAAAPADLADLLQHADALAEENRRLRAALTTLAQPPARELSPYTRDPEVSARMEAARRALEEK